MTKAKDKFTGQFISEREQTWINNVKVLEEQVKDWELRYNAGEKYAIQTTTELVRKLKLAQQENRILRWDQASSISKREAQSMCDSYEMKLLEIKNRNKYNTWLGVGIGILIAVIFEIAKYNLYGK